MHWRGETCTLSNAEVPRRRSRGIQRAGTPGAAHQSMGLTLPPNTHAHAHAQANMRLSHPLPQKSTRRGIHVSCLDVQDVGRGLGLVDGAIAPHVRLSIGFLIQPSLQLRGIAATGSAARALAPALVCDGAGGGMAAVWRARRVLRRGGGGAVPLPASMARRKRRLRACARLPPRCMRGLRQARQADPANPTLSP